MFARLRVVDERVALRAVYNLEVLGTRLTKDRFWRHGGGDEGVVLAENESDFDFLSMDEQL